MARKYVAAESLTDGDLLDFYLDWHDAMRNAFSDADYPPEYPRFKGRKRLSVGGKHACFSTVKEYCIKRGVISE